MVDIVFEEEFAALQQVAADRRLECLLVERRFRDDGNTVVIRTFQFAQKIHCGLLRVDAKDALDAQLLQKVSSNWTLLLIFLSNVRSNHF